MTLKRILLRSSACLFLAMSAGRALCSAQPLLHLQSPHFDLLARTTDRQGQQMLTALESARQFFHSMPTAIVNQERGAGDELARLRIIAFDTQAEYAQYASSPSSQGYFFANSGQNLIVLRLSDSDKQVLLHEYVHYLVRQNKLRLPTWLSEGLADYYSSLADVQGQWHVGSLLPSRVSTLRNSPAISLQALTSLSRSGGDPDENTLHAGFYASSWALTRFLLTSPAYAPHFPDFLRQIQMPGQTFSQASAMAFGSDLNKIERDFKSYLAGLAAEVEGNPTPGRVSTSAEVTSLPALTPAQEREALCRVMAAQPWTAVAARRAVEQMNSLHPNDPEWLEYLGFLDQGGHQAEAARQHFEAAAALGSGNVVALLALYRLDRQLGTSNSNLAALLERILVADPGQSEARINLAILLFNDRQYEQSMNLLAGITAVDPAWAHLYYCLKAYGSLKVHQLQQARTWGDLAQRSASNAQEKAESDRLLDQVSASGE